MNTIIVGDYMYKKIKLNYDSLEPYIDDKTLDIHYNKHYNKYLDNLNKILNNIDYNYKYSVDEIIKNIDEFDSSIRGELLFNAGGVLNHELYFSNMSLKGNIEPKGSLKRAIENKYGNFNNFVMEFMKQANSLKGSGYIFLVVNNKTLDIISLPNQESPYIYGMKPIMALDMWEHAYYLKYQNNKEQYIKNFFSIIDFDVIEKIYEKETKKD